MYYQKEVAAVSALLGVCSARGSTEALGVPGGRRDIELRELPQLFSTPLALLAYKLASLEEFV